MLIWYFLSQPGSTDIFVHVSFFPHSSFAGVDSIFDSGYVPLTVGVLTNVPLKCNPCSRRYYDKVHLLLYEGYNIIQFNHILIF